jgi:hypothetical protein
VRSPLAGHSVVVGPVNLPSALANQPYAQLRWKYYHVSGSSGPRAQLRLDDIIVAEEIAIAPPQFREMTYLPDGRRRLRFRGALLRGYTLETSTNLEAWLPLSTLVTSPGGDCEFVDGDLPNSPVRFYRLRQL